MNLLIKKITVLKLLQTGKESFVNAFYFIMLLFLLMTGCNKDNGKDYIEPTSDFEMVYDTTHPAPVKITFVNKSIYASEYYWTFDDGTFSDVENPVHGYEQGGVYKIELKVTGAGGQDNKKRIIKIDDAYTVIKVTNISISQLPFTTNWDATSGPDVYIKVLDSTNFVAFDNSLNYTTDVDSAQLPLNYDLTSEPIRTTAFMDPIIVRVFDNDSPAADELMGFVAFKPYLLMKNKDDPYPTTLTLTDGDLEVTLTLTWSYK